MEIFTLFIHLLFQEAEKEVPVVLSNGMEVTEIVTEENNVASTSGVASAGGDSAAAVNVNGNREERSNNYIMLYSVSVFWCIKFAVGMQVVQTLT